MEPIRRLSKTMDIVAAGFLVVTMLLTVSDVCLRFFFSRPILGTTEITECMMICIAFLGLAWCGSEKGHLRMDLIMNRFPKTIQIAVDIITDLLGLVVIWLISWRLFLEGTDMKRFNPRISPLSLNLPAYPFYYIAAFGCAIFGLVMLVQIIQDINARMAK